MVQRALRDPAFSNDVIQGTIKGLDGFGVKFVGEFDDVVINNGLISGSNGQALDLGGGNDAS